MTDAQRKRFRCQYVAADALVLASFIGFVIFAIGAYLLFHEVAL